MGLICSRVSRRKFQPFRPHVDAFYSNYLPTAIVVCDVKEAAGRRPTEIWETQNEV